MRRSVAPPSRTFASKPPASKVPPSKPTSNRPAASKGPPSKSNARSGAKGDNFDINSLSYTAPKQVSKPPARARQSIRQRGPPIPENGEIGDRVPCRICGRNFASDRIGTHEDICARTHKKKRPVFNAQKQRLAGTEQTKFVRKNTKDVKPNNMIGGEKKYRVEHENLVRALRAARRMSKYEDLKAQGKARGPPPAMPVLKEIPDGRVPCPICGRKFGPDQLERHQRSCTNLTPAGSKFGMAPRYGGRPAPPPARRSGSNQFSKSTSVKGSRYGTRK